MIREKKNYTLETLTVHAGQEQPDPAGAAQSQMNAEELLASLIRPNAIRLSADVENTADVHANLLADLENVLNFV